VVLLEIQVFWDIFILFALRSFKVLGILTNAPRKIPCDSNLKTSNTLEQCSAMQGSVQPVNLY
jgi:hypothetical protein